MTDIRKTKFYKELDAYGACSIAEGFCGYEPTEEQLKAAWQWLVDTGTCWNLQGWYGRNAEALIENGIIDPPIKDRKDYYGNTVRGVGA